MRRVTTATLIALGFLLGMRHATDADHVIAVSTIVTRQGRLRAGILIGGLWGGGHTLTIARLGRRRAPRTGSHRRSALGRGVPAALRDRYHRRHDAHHRGRRRADDLRLAAAAARRAPPASGLGSAEPRVRPVPRLPHRIRERPVHGPRELDTALSVRSVVASALAPVILLWSSVASA